MVLVPVLAMLSMLQLHFLSKGRGGSCRAAKVPDTARSVGNDCVNATAPDSL